MDLPVIKAIIQHANEMARTPEEIQLCSDYLAKAEVRLSHLKPLLAETRKRSNTSDSLKRRKAELSGEINEQQQTANFMRRLLAPNPIRLLPMDVLGEIFVHYIGARGVLPGANSRPSVTVRPMYLLMQVCRKWRDTALYTPRFWIFIPIFIPLKLRSIASPSPELERHWARIDEVSSRAPHKGFIGVHCRIASRCSQLAIIETMGRLFEILPRAGSLRLEVTISEKERARSRLIFPLPGKDVDTSFSNLRHLGVGAQDIPMNFVEYIVSRSPNLETLQAPRYYSLPTASLPCLVHITLESLTFGGLYNLLLAAPALRHLLVDTMNEYQTFPPNPNRIVRHENLKTIWVQYNSAIMLGHLTLPALEEIVELNACVGVPWPTPDEIRFFARSMCPLKRLKILDREVAPAALSVVQQQLELESLVLGYSGNQCPPPIAAFALRMFIEEKQHPTLGAVSMTGTLWDKWGYVHRLVWSMHAGRVGEVRNTKRNQLEMDSEDMVAKAKAIFAQVIGTSGSQL
ncbi:hypothetical protein CYLTODRAFT_493624 [Cylindrobasidium torrendii FP15055 ss-10]|uniref:F-box domain-containing protein n=1 Tax=Cylindrobasidium torrendii FP15055 ss-10 TaxID=1314674 RepID=A0A0D7AZL8_9AGAR|nr:hypothetical protein CYLTODRAFT_493624 [Cylindrobasidium torrendii FP15055 ss-10]